MRKLPPSSDLRPDTFQTLERYYLKGYDPGSYMLAVLTNDLFGAMGAGDSESLFELNHLCTYIYSYLPASAWGSKEKVRAHVMLRREQEEEKTEKLKGFDIEPFHNDGVLRREE
jgi:hypothetical protein